MTHRTSGIGKTLDDPTRWILPRILLEQAEAKPDVPWLTFTTGERITFAEAASEALRVAGLLAEVGIRSGDRVIVMLPNGPDFVRVWLGLGMLGAVAVLLNTELRGAFLRHQLKNSSPKLAIVDAEFLGAIAEAGAGRAPFQCGLLVVNGSRELQAAQGGACAEVDWPAWRQAPLYRGELPRAQQTACIMYTSGTTGPAKATMMPHAHCALFGLGAIEAAALSSEDLYYIALPLFHANGLLMQLGATLMVGMPAVLRPKFSATSWLRDIRDHKATATNLIGTLAAFIFKTPPTAEDRDHRLRVVLNGPNPEEHDTGFRQRFGVRDVLSLYGMTEVNIPVWGRLGETKPGAAGWVHSHRFDVVIAGPETDVPVAPGEVGEILVRPKVAFGAMLGYHDMPEKTVEAWRNLWFHTGDAGIIDASGLLTFVDRIKDCIRRRGENISATEIEDAIGHIAGISEVAAFAIPSDIAGGDDDVMLAIVADPAHKRSLEELGARVDEVLPRFARPRYLEFIDALPKTGTSRVRRAELRTRGKATAWDRETSAPVASLPLNASVS